MAAMSLLLQTAARAGLRQPLTLSAVLGRNALLRPSASRSGVIVSLRYSSDGKKMFFIRATRFYDHRFVRLMNWYFLLTGIPVLLVVAYANIFIGQAELAEIPEGYIPEHWEYHKHPISRWISRYFYNPPEKEYEKEMARLHIEMEKKKLRKLEADASHLMYERGDGPWHQEDAPGTSLIDYAPKANPDF
ncbi:NADH dehydrogenase [ubiquinone] 1 beta subcomplex subunit 5, mitochondrial [Thamnophis elegans]|uniref:NADH dehydrogenase [ubiquinone] 1 beta subcomplex subunit 5, mitochondrial n=1 Tax=Thamnophis elegans TaxID=35005 RepID=UPI0013769CB4|nr:NADH dehydrogenase [ubiquinone] 1 beta subcomplex subunit 5, mitochondrial [Thamnophis elegans]